MNNVIKKIAPLVILAALLITAAIIKRNPPEAESQRPPSGPEMVVETLAIVPQQYPVRLRSYGTVQPRTQSVLVAQVGGQIVSVKPELRNGGFFEKGDVLATIDPRDYEADVRIAEATLMDARQTLAEADARSEQAHTDWNRLGNSGEAPDLVLRIPQLEAAKARVASARSKLEKSKLDLERTRITAPFAGRILRKFVDIGQVVSQNTQLAEIYASDYVEVRLPLKNRDLRYVELPEAYRFEDQPRTSGAAVTIRSDLGGDAVWPARLVRTEGAIDETARQLHVIAQIDEPFDRRQSARVPLKIGQYVTAELEGITLDAAVVIPNSAIYQGSYVYVVDDGVLQRKNIEIDWQNERDAVIRSGLAAGDALVTTSLGQVTSGIRVQIAGARDSEGRLKAMKRGAKDDDTGSDTP